jgi:hypothetical protein
MDEVGNLLDRPMAYNNVDGVGELSVGFMCLSFGLLSWLQVTSPQGSFWTWTSTMFGFLAVMLGIIHFGCKAIKKHITYPRTGFVEYRRRDAVWRPMIVGGLVSFLLSILLFVAIRRHWSLTTPGPLVGLVLAASYAHGFARTVRWKWLIAAAMAVASVVMAMLPAGSMGAMAKGSWITASVPAATVGGVTLSMVLFGALLLLSGTISFWLYLRNTQAR